MTKYRTLLDSHQNPKEIPTKGGFRISWFWVGAFLLVVLISLWYAYNGYKQQKTAESDEAKPTEKTAQPKKTNTPTPTIKVSSTASPTTDAALFSGLGGFMPTETQKAAYPSPEKDDQPIETELPEGAIVITVKVTEIVYKGGGTKIIRETVLVPKPVIVKETVLIPVTVTPSPTLTQTFTITPSPTTTPTITITLTPRPQIPTTLYLPLVQSYFGKLVDYYIGTPYP